MLVGIPKEIKNNEYRVAITPAGVSTLVKHGHKVIIEKNAGTGAGFSDDEYINAGATIGTHEDAWSAEMVMKVKEPQPDEYRFFREGLILFTYLHLASEKNLTKALVDNKVISIAYETIELDDNSLPLLEPMSEIAGKMSVQVGANILLKHMKGEGILLGGVSGVEKGTVTIIGGGTAGTNAARIAVGLGAKVTILDTSYKRLKQLVDIFGDSVSTIMSNEENIRKCVIQSDLVIGAVLIHGALAPHLVTTETVKEMKNGAVIVDIAIDQGGIFETIDRVTTHNDPVYEKYGVIHYAVANMPGAVPRTSTIALTNTTIQYALKIAENGYKDACINDPALLKGVNTLQGKVTYKAVADALSYNYEPAENLLQ
ncbi:pyridine nucleotide transhydrogenase alpha subunit [Escherichia coli]|uniref:alanine dehydrogenase n=1 Tax=Escherichia coli TaxID=562 RepID=UPI0010CBBBF0|nr:alanine dehydrogenase [Escherichia coli]GCR72558.1 pyridine nucleotide transhydrogenase alpha subunit [Escherichia coli]